MTDRKTIKERQSLIFMQDFRDICRALHTANNFDAAEEALFYALLMGQKLGATVTHVVYADARVKLTYSGIVPPMVRRQLEIIWTGFTTVLTSSPLAVVQCELDVNYDKLGIPAKPVLTRVSTDAKYRRDSVNYDYDYYAGQRVIAEGLPFVFDFNDRNRW